ncbi:MAG: DUF4105 domain-containing protein [Victivallaceae bacterium]|nr:DUF4105 domain-containing protein [Victivallaceae bacterium]
MTQKHNSVPATEEQLPDIAPKGKLTAIFITISHNRILRLLGLQTGKLAVNLIFMVLVAITLALYLWSIASLSFILPWAWLQISGAILFALACPAALIFIKPRRRTFLVITGLVLVITTWQQAIPPTNDHDWQPSVARLPNIAVVGNEVRISNIRNFDYRTETDFTPRYYDRNFKLNELTSLDYILSYWDENKAIAHSIFSFGLKNGDYLAVSVETRLSKKQKQSLLSGIFNQYELIYILADERDILRLRTNFRKEQVYLYRVKINQLLLQKVFVEIIKRAADLQKHPRFYNTLKHNCITTLLADLRRAQGKPYSLDYRFILNGYSDELLFDKGALISGGMPFKQLKEHRHINQYVEKDPNAATDYSKKIRPINSGMQNNIRP